MFSLALNFQLLWNLYRIKWQWPPYNVDVLLVRTISRLQVFAAHKPKRWGFGSTRGSKGFMKWVSGQRGWIKSTRRPVQWVRCIQLIVETSRDMDEANRFRDQQRPNNRIYLYRTSDRSSPVITIERQTGWSEEGKDEAKQGSKREPTFA